MSDQSTTDLRPLKPSFRHVCHLYFHQGQIQNIAAGNSVFVTNFLTKVSRVKQSHDFFTLIENDLEEKINAMMLSNQKDGAVSADYIIVDVKVNDYYLPTQLKLQLESMRKKRGVYRERKKGSDKIKENNGAQVMLNSKLVNEKADGIKEPEGKMPAAGGEEDDAYEDPLEQHRLNPIGARQDAGKVNIIVNKQFGDLNSPDIDGTIS